ncbi:MAG: hypothetical protein CVU84_00115 [Firmicutes bacterium HGW-Firmicutes-1]|jgi:sporulation integral membrane protein YlbJ|nr:MAG: hypothetical protein CVU84_00115 [Firmicutes bacterium HGW-Firmicutes-1]
MTKKNVMMYILIIFALIVLLRFPNESIAAGKEGLLLWFNVIIPTLFPFMILSYIILHSPIIDVINKVFTPFFKVLFGVSGVASYVLIMGILSGYPMGAILINDLVTSKKLSANEGSYLLTFCNNPSPMFVIGFVASAQLCNPKLGLPLLLSIYSGNFITSMLFKKSYPLTYRPTHVAHKPNINLSFTYIDDCMAQTAKVLLKVGGYIILFSIPTLLLSTLPIQHISFKFLISTLDLTNGIHLLVHSSCNQLLKYALLSSLCAFGSLSVVGQTASVLKSSGLPINRYFFSKIINGSITFVCAIIIFELYLQN